MTILNRHIFFNLFPPFLVNLLFFVVIFLITEILEIVNMIVNYNAGLAIFGLLLLYSLPFFLSFIVPMSVMMSVLLTFLRMSADNEITALKSCGISPHRFLAPVVIFCVLGWGLTSFIEVKALPWGNRSSNALAINLAQNNIDAIIKERTFIDAFDDITLYINQVDMHSKALVDVFIEDQRTSGITNTIIAPRGHIGMDTKKHELHLKLYQGTISQVNLENRTADKIDFKSYDMKLDLGRIIKRAGETGRSFDEMSLEELRRRTRSSKKKDERYYKAVMKYHEKFSVPFSCMALGILALPLGLVSRRAKRSYGLVLGIALFLIYFILLSVGWSFGESGTLHPVVGMWAPNTVMGGIGLFLYWRAVGDRTVSIPGVFRRIVFRRRTKVQKDD
jgi:lipopolysaccharide export system permease protein